jgi:hypothetical protein
MCCGSLGIVPRRGATLVAFRVPVFAALALVAAIMPVSAHHSWPVAFDRLVTVKGTVIEFVWAIRTR